MSPSASTVQDAARADGRGRGLAQVTGAGERSLTATAAVHYVYLKRCLDVLLACALIILALPLLFVVCAMIVLDSGWPVFYRQVRVGARANRRDRRIEWVERQFWIVKFRTMVQGADLVPVHERFIESFVRGQTAPEETDICSKLRDDPRITRVGRVLRATSLDELPQLFNVIGGTMSLVGPRPVPPYEVALYEPRHRERLAARPGITGAWQVHGRGRVSFEEMVRLDVAYARRQSLWLDLRLLARTVPAVFRKRGAR